MKLSSAPQNVHQCGRSIKRKLGQRHHVTETRNGERRTGESVQGRQLLARRGINECTRIFVSVLVALDQDVFLCTGSPTAAGYTDSSNPRSVTVTVTLMKRSARVHRAHARWPLCSHARTASSVTRLSLHVEKHTTVRFAALLFNATHVRHDACSCRRSIDFCFANERLTPFCRSLAAPPDDHLDNQDLNLAQRLVTRGDVCDLCMS